ncbi:MAG TPA: head GIN domain-containing protein [Gemmataceae bacterium]|nr:head GIN domain-containing protein [Gemmataceae bacterium]
MINSLQPIFAKVSLPFLLVSLAGCGFLQQTKGSGQSKTETREVAKFSSVSLSGVGKVIIKQTGKESLSVTAEDNLLPLLETTVVDGKLSLGPKKGASINPTKPIEFVVEVKDLQGLEISGAGEMEMKDLQTDRLKVDLSGVGQVNLSGKVDEFVLDMSGAGDFQGADLQTKTATIECSGAGRAVVNVSDILDVSVSGAGSVEYLGSPKVKKSISGVGSVKKR